MGENLFGGFGGGHPMMRPRSRPMGPKTFKLYEVLGVDKDVTGGQLTKAFRKRSIKGEYRHPDKGGDPSKFSELKTAYEKLRRKDSRAEYDKYGDACLAEDFVGTPKRKLRQAKTKTFPLPVTLEQLYNGDTRKIAVTRRVLLNSRTGEVCPATTTTTTWIRHSDSSRMSNLRGCGILGGRWLEDGREKGGA